MQAAPEQVFLELGAERARPALGLQFDGAQHAVTADVGQAVHAFQREQRLLEMVDQTGRLFEGVFFVIDLLHGDAGGTQSSRGDESRDPGTNNDTAAVVDEHWLCAASAAKRSERQQRPQPVAAKAFHTSGDRALGRSPTTQV